VSDWIDHLQSKISGPIAAAIQPHIPL